MNHPTCKTCVYYDANQIVNVYEGAIHPMIAGTFVPKPGACKRTNHITPHKEPNDWCGEHNDFYDYIDSLKG